MAADNQFEKFDKTHDKRTIQSFLEYWTQASKEVTSVFLDQITAFQAYIISLLHQFVDMMPEYPVIRELISPVTVSQVCCFFCGVIFMCCIVMCIINTTTAARRQFKQLVPVNESVRSLFDVFDLAKTAYEKGHAEAVIKEVESRNLDVNICIPSSGLSLFMCACLSGHRRLIQYMIEQGGDPHCTTSQGDTPLYLAAYGILSSRNPNYNAIEDLIDAGCSVNHSNHRGYTPLHRAASKGDLTMVKYLLSKGADPYRCTNSGIYPIDSAVNAGHIEVARALRIDVANPHVWDVIEPHTPPHISLGLMSPRRGHMVESPPPKASRMNLR